MTNAIGSAIAALTEEMDIVATQDAANRSACADIVVDGKVVLERVAVTTLLFLEKQLVDLNTFVESFPTLDPAQKWEHSDEANCFASTSETTRTKKVPKNHVKYEATKEHPAQVELFHEDLVVGYWRKTDFSGAIPQQRKQAMLSRIRQLQDAVKCAREEANTQEVKDVKIANSLLGFVFENSAI